MASSKDLEDDNYIAQLLAQDARDSSIRYAALGLQALLPKRPTNNAPKPNTRFLKNIIQETDNHNAALKKKEEVEARMRLRNVESSDMSPRSKQTHGNHSGRKRRRAEDEGVWEQDRQRKRRSQRSREVSSDGSRSHDRLSRHGSTRGRRDGREESHGSRRHIPSRSHHNSRRASYERLKGQGRSHSTTDDPERHGSHTRRKKRPNTQPVTSGNDSSDDDRQKPYERRRRRRHRSYSSSSSQSSIDLRRIPQQRNPKSKIEPSVGSHKRTDFAAHLSDSDPLESLVGPLPPAVRDTPVSGTPPLRSRGRGAFKPSSSAIDAHFSTNYNPSLDLHPNSEHEEEKDDWDMALEALRDREIWKQKGAERLRAAGFGEEDIKKWEDSGREKGVEDVKWTAKGQEREWDIGKVVESEGKRKGEVSLEAAWKRKGGGFLRDFKKALG